ncbi:MAG: hypothetical protein AAF492_13770, partial [Verrucomicrobiota bacterium]
VKQERDRESRADAALRAEWEKDDEEDRVLAEKTAGWKREREAVAAREKIVQFARDNMGKQVGNGECWTLANEAYKTAGIRRPGPGMRGWGREIDWTAELAVPGDILEMEHAVFPGSRSGAAHTAVIVGCEEKGIVTVLHQNWGRKTVAQGSYNLHNLKSGKVKILRYE